MPPRGVSSAEPLEAPMTARFRVDGLPAALAGGEPEVRWKNALRTALPLAGGQGDERGLRLVFTLPPQAPGRPGADLDNLLDPVLSVLVNGHRWFGGRRPAIFSIHATKDRGIRTGCDVEVLPQRNRPKIGGEVILDNLVNGALPTSARDSELPAWVRQHLTRAPAGRERLWSFAALS